MLLVALACPQVEGVLVSILLRAGIRSTPGLDCCASACYSPWRGCLQLVFQAARGLLSGESDPLPLKFAGVHPVMVCLAVTAGGSTLDEVRTTVQPSATSAERSALRSTVFDRPLVQCQKTYHRDSTTCGNCFHLSGSPSTPGLRGRACSCHPTRHCPLPFPGPRLWSSSALLRGRRTVALGNPILSDVLPRIS